MGRTSSVGGGGFPSEKVILSQPAISASSSKGATTPPFPCTSNSIGPTVEKPRTPPRYSKRLRTVHGCCDNGWLWANLISAESGARTLLTTLTPSQTTPPCCARALPHPRGRCLGLGLFSR